jgi:hypothetical protein
MTTTAAQKPENPYARAYADFVEQTKGHGLVVLHDDGLYRHLRVQAPGTRMWSWDVTTWPGHLATSGDIADGHVFSREPDMLQFFAIAGRSERYYSDGSPSIDVRYWAEKLCGGRSHEVKKYDPDVFLQLVREHLEQSEALGKEAQTVHEKQLALVKKLHEFRRLDEDAMQASLQAYWAAQQTKVHSGSFGAYTLSRSSRDEFSKTHEQARNRLWSTEGISDEQLGRLIEEFDWYELGDTEIAKKSPAVRRQEILDEARWHADSGSEAHKWLQENEAHFGSDTWEWSLREYDIHFLFTCYAIALTTALWREHLTKQEEHAVLADLPTDGPRLDAQTASDGADPVRAVSPPLNPQGDHHGSQHAHRHHRRSRRP